MKATRTVSTEGIPQALAKGHCPVCSLLADVGEIMSGNRAEVLEELTDLLRHLKQGDRTGRGSLGRVAEFLVSQCGISR
jgi:hypothetical protein